MTPRTPTPRLAVMRAKFLVILAATLVASGCSGSDGGTGGISATGTGGSNVLIAPETLEVLPHASGCGALQLKALTLRQGSQKLEMYVALENTGDRPACSPVFSANLLDASETQLGTAVGGLLVRGFFRLVSDPQTTAACVAPGDVTMAAVSDFPAELGLEDVKRVEYFCNLWHFEAVPAGSLAVKDVQAVGRDGGVAYAGTLVNGLEIPLSVPGVTIFSLNSGGRPLGVANSRGTSQVPPGSSWDFETDTVGEAGAAFAAYPTPTL